MLQTNIVLIQACGSLFVLVGHRLESPRSLAMRKLTGDTATTLGMVE
ncbi:hypothetical protein LPJ38_22125 [Bradyrhizobium daqingense]|nr:hypothetical protein [Bradyrhizobium daqingense]UFS86373.1 hypothetical protein LPJ38_22125 [Bradyrhizobium daqingense]